MATQGIIQLNQEQQMADFVLGRIKFVWKGDWTASTAYLADDVVKYGGNAFIAVVNHTLSLIHI